MSGWHWWAQFLHPGGKGYWFWSGIGSGSPLIAPFIFAVGAWWHQHNCHVEGCWRIKWHAHPDHGHPVCKTHHPDHSKSGGTSILDHGEAVSPQADSH